MLRKKPPCFLGESLESLEYQKEGKISYLLVTMVQLQSL